MKRDYTLLKYHMHCNPDYLEGHAVIAYKLSQGELKTYEEYLKVCNTQSVTHYNKELFYKFLGIEAPVLA